MIEAMTGNYNNMDDKYCGGLYDDLSIKLRGPSAQSGS
jgi:hypothetical protein